MKTRIFLTIGLLAGGVLLWLPTPAAASDGQINVVAQAQSACVVTPKNVLNFGTFPALNNSAEVDAQTKIGVACSDGQAYSIQLDGGQNYQATGVANRAMSFTDQNATVHYIGYDIYSDPGFANLWGDGITFGTTVSNTGSGDTQGYLVYGQIPAGQDLFVGSYFDVVNITIVED